MRLTDFLAILLVGAMAAFAPAQDEPVGSGASEDGALAEGGAESGVDLRIEPLERLEESRAVLAESLRRCARGVAAENEFHAVRDPTPRARKA